MYSHGSVTHTNLDAKAWWQVDLGASSTISSIVVWNRTDCCTERLTDYWVFVSDSPFGSTDTPAILQSRAGVWNSHQTTSPTPSTTIAAGGIKGRYVRVQLSSANYLNLAEVQVMGTTSNAATDLAVGKTATQSSTMLGNAASAADGNTDGAFSSGSVTHTNLNV